MITNDKSVPLNSEAYGEALKEYQPRTIHDEDENARATALLERISAMENPSAEMQEIADLLVTLIEKFEESYTLPKASPLESLMELMAANDLRQKDIAQLIGSKGLASEVLNGSRQISRHMARVFGERFNVPHTLFL